MPVGQGPDEGEPEVRVETSEGRDAHPSGDKVQPSPLSVDGAFSIAPAAGAEMTGGLDGPARAASDERRWGRAGPAAAGAKGAGGLWVFARVSLRSMARGLAGVWGAPIPACRLERAH